MESLFSTITSKTSGFGRRLIAPVLAFFIAGDVFLFGYVALHGSQARRAAEQQTRQDIDREDHAVCAELGLGSGNAFAACTQELARVRQRQEERIESDSPF